MKKKKIRERSLGELMAGILPEPTPQPTTPPQGKTPTPSASIVKSSAPSTPKEPEKKAHIPLPSLRKTPSFSVKNAMAGKVSEPPVAPITSNEENLSTSELIEEDEEFESIAQEVELTQRNLEITWEKFAAHIKKNRPRVGFTLLANKPTLLDETNITFEVVNGYQKEEIMTIYNELIHFLRKTLETPNLELEIIEVETESSNARPYTVEEKFKAMASKNPAILALKQVLGLDFE